ncbi:2-dehydro-3-deoxyglucarate aldolase [Hyaloraphidium curvatum]|nr:2-dehydro-3-deoxyglucarate aldolase [Hyaloraphidium curvatum]
MENKLKAKLKAGQVVEGCWINIPSPAVARLAASTGLYDWCLVDGEHMPLDPVTMMEMIHAIASAGSTPLVRIPNHGVEWVKWALDAGAQGIMIPMVNTKEQMETIIKYSKYPPMGQRSYGPTWSKFGWNSSGPAGYSGTAGYKDTANKEVLIMPQIESKEAVDNVDAILSVPGVDLAFVGPFDLHLSLGHFPGPEDPPAVTEALNKVLASCKKHGVAPGIFTGGGAQAKKRAEQGFLFVNPGDTVAALSAGMAASSAAYKGK